MEVGDALARFALRSRAEQFRISHKNFEPMSLPPLEFQGKGRFDDPSDPDDPEPQRYRVLYTAETAVAAFLESLSRFRHTLKSVESLLDNTLLAVDERGAPIPAGVVTADWQEAF